MWIKIGIGAAAAVILVGVFFGVSTVMRNSNDKKNQELYEEYSNNLEKVNKEAEQEMLSSIGSSDEE